MRTRVAFAALAVLLSSGVIFAQSPSGDLPTAPTPPSSGSNTPSIPPPNRSPRAYIMQSVGFEGLLLAGASAGFNQWRHAPEDWRLGAEGYGERFASAYADHLVNRTIHLGVGELHHEVLGYRHSGRQGFGPRLKYALLSSVVTQNVDTGRSTIALGEISGAFGSGIISRYWLPESERTAPKAISAGAVTLLLNSSIHVVREFMGKNN